MRILGRTSFTAGGNGAAGSASAGEPLPVMPQVRPARPRDGALQERLRKLAEARAHQKAAADNVACKRRARRKSTSLPALLTFKTMRTQIACTVVDMSGTGARVRLPVATARAYGDAESLPRQCTLVMRVDRMQVDCEVMWRDDSSLGLRFLGPPVRIPA